MNEEVVQKIDKVFVSNDCVQVMIPYKTALTILSKDGFLYHHNPGSNVRINKYLKDKRRLIFPYNGIPIHYAKEGLKKKVVYTNQLFDYEKTYLEVSDDSYSLNYVIKDNNDAYLVSSKKISHGRIIPMTYDELINYCNKEEDDEEVYHVFLSGALPYKNENIFPSENEINNFIKEKFITNISEIKMSMALNEPLGRYFKSNPWLIRYAENIVSKLDYSLINFDVGIGDPLLIVRTNNNRINIQYIEVVFVKQNQYKVYIYDVPVTEYNLSMIKNLPQIKPKKIKIPYSLNPDISFLEINKAKKMIKSLK